MKLFYTFFFQLICTWLLLGQCTGNATELVFADGSDQPTPDWVVDHQRNGYWLLTNDAGSTPNGEGVITENVDVSGYNRVTINVEVATFGQGSVDRPAIIEYSLDGGTTYSTDTYTTQVPTSSSYIDGGDFTFDIAQNITQLKIRLSRQSGTTGRDVRVRNFYLCGETVSSLPRVSFDLPAYSFSEVSGTSNTQQVAITVDVAPTADADVDVVDIAATAFENADYNSVSTTLTFPANGTYPLTQLVDVTILDDALIEGPESFSLLLGIANNSNGLLQIGANESTEITIDDDDAPSNSDIRINELDATTDAIGDPNEFIELYSPNGGNYSLDGLVLVLFNGSGDKVYAKYSLDGRNTDANGYFLIGDGAATTFVPEIELNTAGIQNGADAVGLYVGTSADFPIDKNIGDVTNALVDGLVYDSDDADESALIAALDLVGQGQINEDGNGMKQTQSIQRGSWILAAPTPRAANALLPVHLTTFTATAQSASVLVQWQTAKEVNNDYFTVERSLDGKSFETIGTVQGSGTTDATTDYRFVDETPATGINYYRLTQTDYDGSSEAFAVRSVTMGTKSDATVFPNPVRESVTIAFPNEVSDADLQVHDLNGRLVLRQNFSGLQAELDLGALNAGTYLLRVNTGTALTVERLVKL